MKISVVMIYLTYAASACLRDEDEGSSCLSLLLMWTPGVLHSQITKRLVQKYGADALRCMISVRSTNFNHGGLSLMFLYL